MRVIVTGATGFIGQALCSQLTADCKVIALTRRPQHASEILGHAVEVVQWDARAAGSWASYVDGSDAIVNLAGANVASGLWTKTRKDRILNSRLDAATVLLDALTKSAKRPKVMIQASATGFYGSQTDEELDEQSGPGRGFLAEVCRKTESLSEEIQNLGVRSVVIRTGIVLGKGGGALPKMAMPFRFYLGGYWGDGRHWLPWISLSDEVAAIQYLITNVSLRGVFNLTAPNPVTNREFFKTLGAILKGPCWLPMPSMVLKVILGEMADELFLSSQRVLPKKLLDSGFEFEYPALEGALKAILTDRRKK